MLISSDKEISISKSTVCIIGSGVGAGTLALKLAEMNISFVIVEAGDINNETDAVTKDHVGRDFKLRTTTSIQLGGTSNLWHGVLSPLDEIDFERRDWIPGSGWPISYNDLIPYYKQSAEILGLEDYNYFDLNKLDEQYSSELKKITFDSNVLENKIFQQPLPAKNFKQDVIKLTKDSDRFHCIYNTVALSFNMEGEKVQSLTVGRITGDKQKITADIYVAAAGALETPRLLLNSHYGNGLSVGNETDNVGRYLMDHPMGNLCQVQFKKPQKAAIYSDLKYKPNIKIKTGLEFTRKCQELNKLPNHNFYMRPSFVEGIDDRSEKIKLALLTLKDGKISFKDVYDVLSNLNVIRQIITYKMSLNVTYKYSDFFFVTEQIPNAQSRVELSSRKDRFGKPVAAINWQLLDQDIESMEKTFRLLLDNVFPADKFKFTHGLDDFNWDDILTSAVHHVGTARMSSTKNDGVTDINQRVFDTSNLYVADGSLFTTAGNVNSSFTISALACRLAQHLEKVIKGSF